MSTFEQDPQTEKRVGGVPSLAANTHHVADEAAPAARPARHRPPAQVAGVVLPAWAPWIAVLGAAVVMALVSVATGFQVGVFAVGTVLLGGVAVYAWSRWVEGARRATDRAVTYGIATAFLLALTPLVSLLWTV